MNNSLIPVFVGTIADNSTQLVNARELHAFLENKDMFSNWISDRINQFDFVENQDFISLLENAKKPKGGRPSKEYHVTIDMAKELSMVERNAKGKQARLYFIECEKQAKTHPTISNIYDTLKDPAQMRHYMLHYVEKVLELEETVKTIQPKADALDRLSNADGTFCLTDAAKNLGMPPQKFNAYLSSIKWIYKRAGSNTWTAYQDKIQAGYLDHKSYTVKLTDGTDKITQQVRITAKGMTKLSMLFGKGEAA
jgi:anti-repressor protein